jgi:hypothetical protein
LQTHQIQISHGREKVNQIRSELFAFPEVLEVFTTGRPDALVVVHSGRPHPGEWLRALRAVGCETPPRRRAVAPGKGRPGAEARDREPQTTTLRRAAA